MIVVMIGTEQQCERESESQSQFERNTVPQGEEGNERWSTRTARLAQTEDH